MYMNSLAKFALSVAGMIGCLGAVAAPVAYTLDPDHTLPRFSINHNGFSNHVGMFTKAAGKAVLDFSARTGSVEVTIQTASFTSGHAFMESVVRGKDFFNAEQVPHMTFKGSQFTFKDDKPSSVSGDLTLSLIHI